MRKTSKKKTLTPFYNKVGKAMQDYYRSKENACYGRGKSCHGRAEVMHHHHHWGSSVALRFEPRNLVPLCSACHCAFHKNNALVKFNYETEMQNQYGQLWEESLFTLEQVHVKKPNSEKRLELQRLLEYYQNNLQ